VRGGGNQGGEMDAHFRNSKGENRRHPIPALNIGAGKVRAWPPCGHVLLRKIDLLGTNSGLGRAGGLRKGFKGGGKKQGVSAFKVIM